MKPLQNEPASTDNVLYVFYDFETTQVTKYTEKATVHVPNLVCLQQLCSKCESIEDIEQDCLQCGRLLHSFWQDPAGDVLFYLCEQRPWVNKVIAITNNAKSYDLQFLLNRAILLKWQPEIILNGLKKMCLKFEHIVFLESVSFMPLSLRKLPEAFGMTSSNSWYPHYFNTKETLDYIGPIPDVSYYSESEMGISERREFLECYEGQNDKPCDNKRVLESYFEDDVTVLRQAW
jgi:hypothetical protein